MHTTVKTAIEHYLKMEITTHPLYTLKINHTYEISAASSRASALVQRRAQNYREPRLSPFHSPQHQRRAFSYQRAKKTRRGKGSHRFFSLPFSRKRVCCAPVTGERERESGFEATRCRLCHCFVVQRRVLARAREFVNF